MSNAPPSVDPPELAQHREKVKNKRAIESLMNLDSISHSSDGTDIHATIGKAMSRKTLDAVEEKFGKYFGYLARCEEDCCI